MMSATVIAVLLEKALSGSAPLELEIQGPQSHLMGGSTSEL